MTRMVKSMSGNGSMSVNRVVGYPDDKVRVRKGTHAFRLRVKDDKNAMSQAIVTLRVT